MTNCSFEGCPHPSECIVSIEGQEKNFCHEHIPNIEFARTKDTCHHNKCIFNRTRGYPNHRGAVFCRIHATPEMAHTASKFCDFPGCRTNPIFGMPGTKTALCCLTHKYLFPGAVVVRGTRCECGAGATHNMPEIKKPLYCAECAKVKLPGAINVKSRRCEACKKSIPSYGIKGSNHATHCAPCGIPLGLVDIRHPVCEDEGCLTIASRDVPDEAGIIHHFCATHGGDATDKNARCEGTNEDGAPCLTHPAYDLPEAPRARFCARHKSDQMINIKAYLCIHGRRCTFNFPGLPARFCAECRTEGMVDVVGKMCEKCKETRACFGFPPGKARFCIECKDPGMVNVSDAYCDEPGCQRINPIFGFPKGYAHPPGTTRAQMKAHYCKMHIKPGMEDIRHPFCDCPQHKRATFYVKGAADGKQYCLACKPANAITENPTCPGNPEDPCELRATYGPLFGPPIHCAKHTADLDADGHRKYAEFTNRYPKCQGTEDCCARPTFSIAKDNFPTHCPVHAPLDAREVVEGRCITCSNVALIGRQGSQCAPCELGIDREAKKTAHHTREKRMHLALQECGLTPTAHGKCLPQLAANGCRKRPDFYFDCGSTAIILEVDENQHGGAITFRQGEDPLILNISEDTDHVIEARPTDPYADDEPQPAPCVDASGAGTSASAQLPVVPGQHAHRPGYTRDRELARMIEIHKALGVASIHVRYNPDSYHDHEGVAHAASRGQVRDIIAAKYVKSLIDKYTMPIDDPRGIEGLYVAYMFYDGQKPNVPETFIIDLDERVIEGCDV